MTREGIESLRTQLNANRKRLDDTQQLLQRVLPLIP